MIVTRTSRVTGKVHTMNLDITEDQISAYNRGALLQDAFPNLSADEREFFFSGITAEEWAAIFPPDEDEDPDDCSD